jgi:short-subunit dehydrogenase
MTTASRPVALITGASGGIGLELARLCAKGGHDLILVARRREKLEEIAKYLGGMYNVRSEIIVADLTDPAAPRAIYDQVEALGLSVDVLINNAGFGQWGLFGRAVLSRQLDMIHVNITALTELTRLFMPKMITARKGRIMNVSSVAGFMPGPLIAVYYASKAFVLSFTEAIGNELQGTGITATALCPGPTKTGFADEAGYSTSNLFATPGVMEAAPVALAGYRGMKRGKAVVIPGWKNKALIFALRLGPRWLVRMISRKLQETRGNV